SRVQGRGSVPAAGLGDRRRSVQHEGCGDRGLGGGTLMLRKRVIVCLDVQDGRVVKGTKFTDLRDVGDPVELAARYEREGADEIVFLDISATPEGRGTLLDAVRRTAEQLFIP